MKTFKKLEINGTMLTIGQLEKHLEKIALEHNLTNKSAKETYPVPQLLENFETIQNVYKILNEHLKLGINIHPAGEWILDNLYVIEETVKIIQKELTLKKYINFQAIAEGTYKGFARIYVLASEIIAYTDNKINKTNLEKYLLSYQTKKLLTMDEIWNIGIFLEISIIDKIANICKSIYSSQIQKYKAENIAERLIENKNKNERIFKIKDTNKKDVKQLKNQNVKYPFIEYMSFILKRYGRKGSSFLKALEETIEMTGTTVWEVIKKEHFDIAVKKVLIGNGILSIKEIQRMNFLDMFEKINGVEDLLRQDPAGVYDKMNYETKEYYRMKIKEISNKTKISELYITKKILEIANTTEKGTKKSHIGYYIICEGIADLYKKLGVKVKRKISKKTKVKIYISSIFILSIIISILISATIDMKKMWLFIINVLILIIPASEVITQLIQWILGKIVKPKIIPKINFENGLDNNNSTMVVIPTIIDSVKKVEELVYKLEVYYLANKSKNIYFTLLGDCSQSDKKEEKVDEDIIKIGIEKVKELNKKYKNEDFPIFNFIYRKRIWNENQGEYLGWERKRGLLNQFNEYLLNNVNNPFRANTIEENKEKMPQIKYVITLDSDTDLILNSALELIGTMAHILNKPVIDEKKNIVIDGYGIIQPRIGVDLDVSFKNLFTKIFAGSGGIDLYTNAISDTYQDNFDEGIFTGKGIYDLQVFSQVLKNEIPENTVLSHDLLEGSYLRCGLASDIMLMDGYPTKYLSFTNRLARWIRGDWQIIRWLGKKSNLNMLSKFKIFDNLRRSLVEISIMFLFIELLINVTKNIQEFGYQNLKGNYFLSVSFIIITTIFPFILDIFNNLISKKENEKVQKTFSPKISGIKGAILRALITLACVPYKAYVSLKSIIKTIYRMSITHKNLLEWTTSEDAERQSKTDILTYTKAMFINSIFGIISIIFGIIMPSIVMIFLGALWTLAPSFMCYISKSKNREKAIDKINDNDKKYVLDIAKRTWKYFETYLNKETNYLIPDNYQEVRKEKIVYRTSSTNIGLSILAVISAYDLEFINYKKTLELLENIINIVDELPKWNGHLYNWYNIKTKEPLIPRYISTVDSGNFIGYLYVTKSFLENLIKKNIANKEKEKYLYEKVNQIINKTNFGILYDNEHQIFSIGFNIEENKLTDSYYDLLASEARQASLIAIAKKEVPQKHWNSLSRTLTTLGKYKGLISWSGTAFEYLMPNINIPKYEGSLLDESCKFLIMSQIKYANILGIPWGISESAFNVKDLHSNYQYKAFGIPWLGLKRGLADEMVVSSYGSILAINEVPKEVINNLKDLQQRGVYSKYGFYEALDLTPQRVEKGKRESVVSTYMAHHQALILLSLNNFINDNILQKRFISNPEIESVSILLQERIPEKSITTKEKKERVEKPIYKGYENYQINTFNKVDERLITGNIISSEDYTIAIDQKGRGISKYKDVYINRFKSSKVYNQGINICIKNIKTKAIWNSMYSTDDNQYKISFMPDKSEIEKVNGNIKSKIENIIAPNEPVEIRRITLENNGNEEEILEITSYFEPVLSNKKQDYAHPAFNNLFLVFEYEEESKSIIVCRKNRDDLRRKIYLQTSLNVEEAIGDVEYELDKEKFLGRGNLGIPQMVRNSSPFSKKIGLTTEPIIAIKRVVKVPAKGNAVIDLIISVGEDKELVKNNFKKYMAKETVKETFKLSKAKVEEESRYLGIKGENIELYQKIMSYIIFDNPNRSINIDKLPKEEYAQKELWKYGISGDIPIILVKIKDVNDGYVAKEVLKTYEYLKTKNIEVETVFLDEEKYSYENYVREEIENSILNNNLGYLRNIRGGIFTISKSEISKKDMQLLEFVATVTIDSTKGGIANNIKEIEEKYLENYKEIPEEITKPQVFQEENKDIDILEYKEKLKYFNEYGGFSEDGKEYLIKTNLTNRLPAVWSNILANKNFGTVVTDSMGGYTWFKNSRLNRISSWENDSCLDIPSEIIYIKDEQTKKCWSLGQSPMPDNNNYNIKYGFGYSKYIHKSNGIE